NLLMTAIGDDVSYWLNSAMRGILLADYTFDKYHSDKKETPELNLGILTGVDSASFKKEEQYSHMMASAVALARDLVNEPANVMTPSALAEEAKAVCDKHNIKCTILEKEDWEALGMTAFLSDAKGSKQPPKFIVMEYNGRVTDEEKIALIGKGICFDAGGYNLMLSASMKGMHGDMGGAAAVGRAHV